MEKNSWDIHKALEPPPGTPRGPPGTPRGPPGPPGDAPGTPRDAPGSSPGTPLGPPGTLMDHKNGHISTNVQRQKLSIAVFEPACGDPSPERLDRSILPIKRPPKSKKGTPRPGISRLRGTNALRLCIQLYIDIYNLLLQKQRRNVYIHMFIYIYRETAASH